MEIIQKEGTVNLWQWMKNGWNSSPFRHPFWMILTFLILAIGIAIVAIFSPTKGVARSCKAESSWQPFQQELRVLSQYNHERTQLLKSVHAYKAIGAKQALLSVQARQEKVESEMANLLKKLPVEVVQLAKTQKLIPDLEM